jgi:hypothetical protein
VKEEDEKIRVRERCENATLLALKTEERTMCQGMLATSESWKKKSNSFPKSL